MMLGLGCETQQLYYARIYYIPKGEEQKQMRSCRPLGCQYNERKWFSSSGQEEEECDCMTKHFRVEV